jgi:hypothetical protein
MLCLSIWYFLTGAVSPSRHHCDSSQIVLRFQCFGALRLALMRVYVRLACESILLACESILQNIECLIWIPGKR